MAYRSTHPVHAEPDTGVHIITWTLAIVGLIAAAIGAWIAAAPAGGTLTVFNTTWEKADIADFWAPTLLLGGGGVAVISMITSALRDWQHHANRWLLGIEIALALLGVAAVVIGVVALF